MENNQAKIIFNENNNNNDYTFRKKFIFIQFTLISIILIYTFIYYYPRKFENKFSCPLLLTNTGKEQLLVAGVIIGIAIICNFETVHRIFYKKSTEVIPENLEKHIKLKNCDLTFLRGKKYFLGKGAPKDCFLTFFNLEHFLLYVLAGFLCPNLIFLWISVGFFWETVEAFPQVDCWDFVDIAANISGLFVGIYLRKLFDNKMSKKNLNKFK